MEAKIFNAISDPDFRIKAFSDYCDDTQQAYQRLIQAETMALEAIPDDPESSEAMDYDQTASDILDEVGISESNMLLFNEGYISSKDYIASLLRGFDEVIVHEEGSLIDKQVQLTDANGTPTQAVDLDKLTLEVKENLYSITALCAANSAATEANPADRIAVFNDRLTSVFQNAYSTVSSTATYLRAMISDTSFRSSEYLAKVDAITGISILAADGSTDVPLDMDITKYTGANPACALNFNGFFNTVSTVANVGLKVVGGILSAGARLVGNLFSKVGSFFHTTLINPYDIQEINANSTSYTVDGWRYNAAPYDPETNQGTDYHLLGDSEFNGYLSALSDEDIRGYVGRWVKYETIFGELMFKLDRFTARPEDSIYEFFPYAQFKPRAVNSEAVYLCAKEVWGEDSAVSDRRQINSANPPTTEQLLRFIDLFRNQPDMYLSTDSDERRLCLGFACGAALTDYFGLCALTEMLNSLRAVSDQTAYPVFNMANIEDWIGIDFTRKATNIDFVAASSGWVKSANAYHLFPNCPSNPSIIWRSTPFPRGRGTDICRDYFLAWILNRADRKLNPTGYTFVPYRNDVDSWAESRFRIKTDGENKNAFTNLMTVALATVVTAFLSISVTIGIKKLVRDLYIKRTIAVGALDRAMWSGVPLTNRDKRRYVRLQRKLNASTALSSGLQDSSGLFESVSNAISTVSEDASGVTQIVSLIKA